MDLLQYVESLSLNDRLLETTTQTTTTTEATTTEATTTTTTEEEVQTSPMNQLCVSSHTDRVTGSILSDSLVETPQVEAPQVEAPALPPVAIEIERKTPTSFSVGFDDLTDCPVC